MNMTQLEIEKIVALAFAAYRLNNQCIHTTDNYFDEEAAQLIKVTPNKKLMADTILAPTDEDLSEAKLAIDMILKEQVLRILRNHQSSFFSNMAVILSQEKATKKDFGALAWVPVLLKKIQEQNQLQEKILHIEPKQEYLGTVGAKVTFDLTVLSTRHIKNLGCWIVEGHDGLGHCVNFFTKNKSFLTDGRYSGKIKKTEINKFFYNFYFTTCSHVKRIEKK
jgi:hypothetical protein